MLRADSQRKRKKKSPQRKDYFCYWGEGQKSNLQNSDRVCKRQNLKTHAEEHLLLFFLKKINMQF